MTTFPLKKSEGHFIIIVNGDNYIIDTGASISCSCYGQTELVIGDRKFDVYPLPLEKVGEKISEKEGYVRFGCETNIECGDYAFTFEVTKGFRVLTTGLKVNGKDTKVILDSGARIDYMDPSLLDTTIAVSHEMDYNPIIGSFEVDGYKATYAIGDRVIDTVSYAATEKLKAYVSQLGIHDISGVVGLNGLIKGMKSLSIDFRNCKVILKA